MKAVKKINNNIALCLDSKGRSVIATGKGIGFPRMPYEIIDLSSIDQTFYDITQQQIDLLTENSEEVLAVTMDIVEKGRRVFNQDFSGSFIFSMADHLQFALDRLKKGIIISSPIGHDLKHLYEKEMSFAKWAISYVNKKMSVRLPQEEATNIAMHFINEINLERKESEKRKEERVVEDLSDIIENEMNCIIDRDGFYFSRFISHVQYLLKRKELKTTVLTDNLKLFESMKIEYPKTYQAVLHMQNYFLVYLNWELSDEELLYLMIHTNRLYSRRGL